MVGRAGYVPEGQLETGRSKETCTWFTEDCRDLFFLFFIFSKYLLSCRISILKKFNIIFSLSVDSLLLKDIPSAGVFHSQVVQFVLEDIIFHIDLISNHQAFSKQLYLASSLLIFGYYWFSALQSDTLNISTFGLLGI